MKTILIQAFIVGLVIAFLMVFTGCANFGEGQMKIMGKCYKVENTPEETNNCLSRGWRQ